VATSAYTAVSGAGQRTGSKNRSACRVGAVHYGPIVLGRALERVIDALRNRVPLVSLTCPWSAEGSAPVDRAARHGLLGATTFLPRHAPGDRLGCYRVVYPPLAKMVWPVIQPPSPARKVISGTMSSMWVRRPPIACDLWNSTRSDVSCG